MRSRRLVRIISAIPLVKRAFLSEHVVIMLGEAVGLVANVLEQAKGEGSAGETIGSDLPWTKISSSRLASAITVGGTTLSDSNAASAELELPLAAVDQPDVGKRLVALLQALDPARDDLANRREVVDARRRS